MWSVCLSVCLAFHRSHANCYVCKRRRSIREETWSRSQLDDALRGKSKLFCTMCRENGYTERATEPLKCRACRQSEGRVKFDAKLIHNCAADKKRVLICLACAEREKHIIRKSSAKEAFGCTCRCPLHTDKCKVYRKWPGFNVGITVADLQFFKFRPSNETRFNLKQI